MSPATDTESSNFCSPSSSLARRPLRRIHSRQLDSLPSSSMTSPPRRRLSSPSCSLDSPPLPTVHEDEVLESSFASTVIPELPATVPRAFASRPEANSNRRRPLAATSRSPSPPPALSLGRRNKKAIISRPSLSAIDESELKEN